MEKADKHIKKNGGRSIEERSESIEGRKELGHREMGIVYFYAHSYCSYERGSNENNNRFIRRFDKY